jgi:PAT family beta-lactamase induction signal transducer AmpG
VETNDGERKKGLLWTSTAYFAEGLPWSFLHQVTTEYLQSIHASPEHVGYTSWFHLPVTAKPLFSPAIDLVGTRRRWMIATQLAMGILIGVLASLVALGLGASEAPWLWGVLIAIAILHAVHDIACDGLYMLALSQREQALFSGTRIAAFRVAMYVGGSLLVIVAARASWTLAIGVAGTLMAMLALVNAVIVPRAAADVPRTRTGDRARGVLASYATFLRQPSVILVLAFVISHGLSDAMTFAMSAPMQDELGIDLELRGWIRGASLTSSIGAALLAGFLVARYGLGRLLAPLTYLMAVPFYLVIALLRPSWPVVMALVAVEQFTGNLAATALTVFLMRRCRKQFSASHYAFFTALTALGRTIAGGFSGHLFRDLGPVGYFTLCCAVALPAVILVHFVPKTDIQNDEGRALDESAAS